MPCPGEQRNRLGKDTLQHGLTVRDMRKRLRKDATEGTESTPIVSQKLTRFRSLVATVQDFTAQVAAMNRSAGAFGKHLLEEIKEAEPVDINPAISDPLITCPLDRRAEAEVWIGCRTS